MKQMIAFSAALLLATLALCIGSTWKVRSHLDEMSGLHAQALTCTENEDVQGALAGLTAMAQCWADADEWMEMLADHEDVHNVREQIVSAKALLAHDDMAQYQQCMALVREGLDHIRRSLSMSLSNIL